MTPGSAAPHVGPADDALVAATHERLHQLDALPVEEHVRVFDEVHALLTGALRGTGDGHGGPPPP